MSTFRFSFWVVVLAIINACACIRIKSVASKDTVCLERAHQHYGNLLAISVCNRENLREHFYFSGDLTQWDSASIKENDVISGAISTECGPENMKFLNETAGFSSDPINFNFKLIMDSESPNERIWQIQLNSNSTECFDSKSDNSWIQECKDNDDDFKFKFEDFKSENNANCDFEKPDESSEQDSE